MPASANHIIPELESDPVQAVKSGLPVERFDRLKELLNLPVEELLRIIGISTSTLARRRKQHTFKTQESDRLARLAQLLEHTIDTLGNVDRARDWFKSPKKALSGHSPLEYSDTEQGAREIEKLLIRLDHGVFS